MPFSGGGGGQLTNHVHDLTPLQGGPLNFNNTTIAGMNAGDITYSDGAALQTLTYPAVPSNETLTAAALSTAPAWVAAAAATSAFELIESVELSGTAAFIESTFTSISGADISCIQVVYDLSKDSGGVDFSLQYGSGGALVTSGYYSRCFNLGSVTTVILSNTASWLLQRNPNFRHQGGVAQIYVSDPDMVASNNDMIFTSTGSNSDPTPQISGGTKDGTENSIDRVRISISAGSLQIGSKMSVYRLNRT